MQLSFERLWKVIAPLEPYLLFKIGKKSLIGFGTEGVIESNWEIHILALRLPNNAHSKKHWPSTHSTTWLHNWIIIYSSFSKKGIRGAIHCTTYSFSDRNLRRPPDRKNFTIPTVSCKFLSQKWIRAEKKSSYKGQRLCFVRFQCKVESLMKYLSNETLHC